MLNYFYAKDFRNLKEVEIYPSEYINLISGNNGEGKSSILYGIEYLLTDNLNEKMSEYIRWGCDKFILKGIFTIDSDKYEIKVECAGTAKKELIINDDKENIYKNSQATKKLAEVINPNIVRYSSISEQGKTAQILFDLPANRLKKLKEILGIDKIADISDEIKKDIDIKDSEIKEADKEIRLLEERQYNFLEVPVVQDITDLRNCFDILEKDKMIYELELKQWDNYNSELEKYNESVRIRSVNTLNIEIYKKQIIEKELSQMVYKHTETEEELREQFSKYEKEKIEQEYKTENFKKVLNKIEELKSCIANENQALEKLQLRRLSQSKWSEKDLKDTEEVNSLLKIELPQLEKELKLCEQGKCPTCGKDYIIENVDELIKKIEDYKSVIKTNDTFISQVKKDTEDYSKAFNEQEIIKVKRQNILDKINSYNEELIKVETELKENSNQTENTFLIDYSSMLKDIKDKLDNRKEVLLFNVNISNQIKELESNIKVCEALINQYKDIIAPKECIEPKSFNFTEYENCKKDILIHETLVKEKERVEEHNKKIIQEKLTNLERIKFLRTQIDLWSFEVGILKESRQVLDKDFSAWLIDQGAEYLKEKMNEFFFLAYGKYDITFSQDKNSIDFYYGIDGSVAPCSMASGSERDILALSFRLAISSLSNFNFMILDEIDSQLSEEKAIILYESLLNYSSETQLFVISHCDAVKELLTNTANNKSYYINNGCLTNK
jgi:DNA repair exonuclease SbcCD ATPase subunit